MKDTSKMGGDEGSGYGMGWLRRRGSMMMEGSLVWPLLVVVGLVMFGVLIFVHELGHYIFARYCGIFVSEFAVGFGPRAWSKKWGDTIYSVRWIPIGGFVRMAGMLGAEETKPDIPLGHRVYVRLNGDGGAEELYLYDPGDSVKKGSDGNVGVAPHFWITGWVRGIDTDRLVISLAESQGEEASSTMYPLVMGALVHRDSERSPIEVVPKSCRYDSKTLGQRVLTIFGGPLANLLFTIPLFALFTAISDKDQWIITHVAPGSIAMDQGLQSGDILVSVDEFEVLGREFLRNVMVRGFDSSQSLKLTVKRGDRLEDVTFPHQEMAGSMQGRVVSTGEEVGDRLGALGIQGTYVPGEQGWLDVPKMSLVQMGWVTSWTVKSIKDILQRGIPLQGPDRKVSGMLGILFSVLPRAILSGGVPTLVFIMAVLSINLAILNLIPFIPMLDGGRLFLLFIEMLIGRPIDERIQMGLYYASFVFLMLFLIYLSLGDVLQWIQT